MEEEKKNNQQTLDIVNLTQLLYSKKKIFIKAWAITFILSVIWIFPQPRYYACEVSLAPESNEENVSGGLASLASNFGVNLGGTSNDAIYPELYPDLFESPAFVVDLFGIQVKTLKRDIHCDYYTYLAKYKKRSPLGSVMKSIGDTFSSDDSAKSGTGKNINPFMMSKFDNGIVKDIQENISCSVDKKNDVISIKVKDQDPLVCALLADSIRERLQAFITEYRTHKARLDVQHYQELADSANLEYRSAMNKYAQFCDANEDITLQSQISKRDELENEMQSNYNTYQALNTQLEAMKAKLQEKTPAFTTLKSATVPVKPAGPKRMLFVILMMFVVTFGISFWYVCKQALKNSSSQPVHSAA